MIPFTRDRIEIGSKTIRIVFDPINFYHSVYTGSDPKLFPFTRDQIYLVRSELARSAHVPIGKEPLAPVFIKVVCQSLFCMMSQLRKEIEVI